MRTQADKGAAAVELAMVLPVLLLLVFGIIDFGRMLNAQISVTEAAREGARAAVVDSTSSTAAQDRIDLINSDYEVVAAESTTCASTSAPGDNALVVVEYDFTWVTPMGALAAFFGGGPFGTVTIEGKGVMPCRA
ncbi:TadE/TadG family type IV pilus assembly protein [Catellatospora sp. NPDC049609]|uniref:TadE/TadG family type IV pilus assembly protein n=1 Tax=Catellatospora sp. NPDC049609 TaxID=3155505 RepID=UPI00341601AE